MDRKKFFLSVFRKAEKKYTGSKKRLAGDAWEKDWQTLITTIMSAQSRDETTIPIAENLFGKYKSLEALARAKEKDVLGILRSLNYNRTKTRNIIACAKMIVRDYEGKIPDNMDGLVNLPGVGRKTANLFLAEVHKKDTICVDTHVHRISNVLGLVKTKNPAETEKALEKLAPKRYWSRINRIFVLWGKDVSGKDKKKLLARLEN